MLNLPVVLTDEALLQVSEIPSNKDYKAVTDALRSLDNMNEAYGFYVPGYEAARPPFDCRVCFAGNYAIYFTIIKEEVVVFSVCDNRLDPNNRFADIDDIEILESFLLEYDEKI